MHAAAAVEAAAGTVHTAAVAVGVAARVLALGGAQASPHEGADAADEGALPAAASAALMGRDALFRAPAPVASPAQRPAVIHPGAVLPVDPRSRFRRVAIIHYWLVTMRGGERVLERLLQLFPEADIFTHVYDPAAMSAAIRARTVRTSFIQRLPGARKHYQAYLPLMPMALEQLDLRGYDLVISSESGPAKGVIPAPDALHLCYVHSPMRYLWDHYHDYRAEAGWLRRAVMPMLCHGLRQWDTSSAARVDRVLANSRFIRDRIGKAWRREAAVVHPPVDPALFTPSDEVEPGYLWVGQLVPYKRADLAIDAFNALGLPLTVVGDGPQAAMLRKRAGPTIRMIPRLDFAALRQAYARCRALVFTAEEDFGIVPVEVMASGRPVVAYGRGGALDSVVEGRTGMFFAEQTTEALVEAVRQLERWLPHFDPASALARARDFAPERFDAGVLEALA
jgi:glycosyltransferase involved in cell wall biosynthesis